MEKYKIFYDKWFFESELHKSGAVKAVVDLLTEKGLTYEKDGAVWYKNKEVLTQKLLKEGKSQKYIDNLELKGRCSHSSERQPDIFYSRHCIPQEQI